MNTYKNPLGYYTNVWCRLAEVISDRPLPKKIVVEDLGVAPFVNLLYKQDKAKLLSIHFRPSNIIGLDPPKYKFNKKDKRCLLGFSGGKDSCAMAIKLMREGYKVTAFHVRRLNRSALDEEKAAADVCRLLEIPLVINTVAVTGKSTRVESPCKNLIVLAMMVDYGGPFGVGNYALGTEVNRDNGVDGFKTDWDFSDSVDVLNSGASMYKRHPNFNFRCGEIGHHQFDNSDSFETVLSHKRGMEILDHSRSCMNQFRFRKRLNKVNADNYGVKLLTGRCGSCWKCCLEFMHLEAMGYMKHNGEYRKHCTKVIRKFQAADNLFFERLDLTLFNLRKSKTNR